MCLSLHLQYFTSRDSVGSTQRNTVSLADFYKTLNTQYNHLSSEKQYVSYRQIRRSTCSPPAIRRINYTCLLGTARCAQSEQEKTARETMVNFISNRWLPSSYTSYFNMYNERLLLPCLPFCFPHLCSLETGCWSFCFRETQFNRVLFHWQIRCVRQNELFCCLKTLRSIAPLWNASSRVQRQS